MGCGSSKEKVCQNCQAPYVPVRRTYSMHVHHPPNGTGDSYHLVALKSSTLGSLKLDPSIQNRVLNVENQDEALLLQNHSVIADKALISNKPNGGKTGSEGAAKDEFVMGMIEAKTWSRMINEKIPNVIPKTPVRTPPGEPEMINAWEMMEGLEDISPPRPVHHFRSFSFNVPRNSSLSSMDDLQPTPRVQENGTAAPKSSWLDLADNDTNSNSNSNDTSIVSEFDPEVIAEFRKSLEDLPPANPFYLKSLDGKKEPALAGKDRAADVKKNEKSGGKHKLIVYFTSLRGVRKTYEDCCHVRVILKGLGVKVDERDVSMHSRFKDELKELLRGELGHSVGLPRVFLGESYIGGADEIRRLNEEGKLEKMVEKCEFLHYSKGGGGNGHVCEACGDIRFVPCETCSGSCKIYYEGEYDYGDEEESEENEHECGFRRCQDCNENGLVLCPVCCD
ncbi:hypothetical protein F511_29609 [Dorcoceras hygrometricum]|uniref:Glutaredoxin domain-containing protein n=1 Tax=Dorcoceras hygrometricum TaxID=472368 RepID=A0A2Z7CK94_9LAMI|nr:hypothetical protein F511_29609 [Dorcoceras hygrometricum]